MSSDAALDAEVFDNRFSFPSRQAPATNPSRAVDARRSSPPPVPRAPSHGSSGAPPGLAGGRRGDSRHPPDPGPARCRCSEKPGPSGGPGARASGGLDRAHDTNGNALPPIAGGASPGTRPLRPLPVRGTAPGPSPGALQGAEASSPFLPLSGPCPTPDRGVQPRGAPPQGPGHRNGPGPSGLPSRDGPGPAPCASGSSLRGRRGCRLGSAVGGIGTFAGRSDHAPVRSRSSLGEPARAGPMHRAAGGCGGGRDLGRSVRPASHP